MFRRQLLQNPNNSPGGSTYGCTTWSSGCGGFAGPNPLQYLLYFVIGLVSVAALACLCCCTGYCLRTLDRRRMERRRIAKIQEASAKIVDLEGVLVMQPDGQLAAAIEIPGANSHKPKPERGQKSARGQRAAGQRAGPLGRLAESGGPIRISATASGELGALQHQQQEQATQMTELPRGPG